MTTSNYNLDRIRSALNKQTGAKPGGKVEFTKNKYFKPGLGKYDLRFLPYLSPEGEPIQEVLYYEKLTEDGKRIVAPQSFGLPDPIREVFDEKRREKDGWKVAKFLKPKKRYYALVIDRKDEAAGPQIWEFSEELRDSVYAVLVSQDYQDEYLFDPDKGYDWELLVTQALDAGGKPRTFNGNMVKKFTLNVRKRPSPLHKDRTTADKWVSEMPKLVEMFTRMSKNPEELIEILENFVARIETQGEPKSEEGTEHHPTKKESPSLASTTKKSSGSSLLSKPVAAEEEEVDDNLDNAFAGLAD